jgi:signal transduction histidine kinase/DNA-binding response OmpR family regulator
MAPHQILIVEDEGTIAFDLRNHLTRRGHAVVGVAASGEDALAQARRHRPDLVMMDIVIEGSMDGIEAAAAIRSELNIPAIYLTACVDPAMLDRAKPTQPLGYLVKPFSERDLAVTLEIGLARVAVERRVRVEAQAAERAHLAALYERDATLNAVLDALPVGVILADASGKIVRDNAANRALWGIAPEAASWEQYGEWVGWWPETGERIKAGEWGMARALLHGEVITGELVECQQFGTGRRRFFLNNAAPVRNAEGSIAAGVVVQQDVTEARRAEAAVRESEARLRELNESLERRVEEELAARTKVEETLRHSQKMEAVGRIAAGVAHDFNNTLQGVMSALELVLDEVGPGTRAHEFAHLALGSTRRGAYLTHHLLSYARKQALQPQAVDMVSFLEDMRKLLTRTLGPHIAVEVPAPAEAGTPLVHVDPSQLQTALLNLAINAAHAMAGGGTLRLEAHLAHDGQRVVVAVSDTGTGMDEATLAQAFEPFFTTKGREGTGLGLSMVQGFAEQSGGEVRIASAPNRGTTVELRLPVAAASGDGRSAGAERQEMLQVCGRVLLVDDDPDVLVTMGAFLERAGLRVARASGGVQALAILASGERFDALVTDHAMPGLNGADLVAEGRLAQPGLPALIITGFAEIGREKALPEGVRMLHKPFPREELIAALHQVMRVAQENQA